MFSIFRDTKTAFAHLNDKELKASYRIFALINNKFLVKFGLYWLPILLRWHFPLVKTLIKNTIFRQFMGGTSLANCRPVVEKLGKSRVSVILDYAAEAKNTAEEFERAKNIFIEATKFAALEKNIPFVSIKLSALGSEHFFQSFNKQLNPENNLDLTTILESKLPENLPSELQNEYAEIVARLEQIIDVAVEQEIPIMVDAEESWVQDAMDFITHILVKKYNKNRPFVYHTFQLYRADKLVALTQFCEQAQAHNYQLGVKIVRGAYMEKEAIYAQENQRKSPIHLSQEATNIDYNKGINLCTEYSNLHLIIATHNEASLLYSLEMLEQNPQLEAKIYFSQLYGMGDHFTFHLAQAGYKVCKYLPFASIHDAVPYLIRRAQENSSFEGQSRLELQLLAQEKQRRGL